MRRWEPSSLCDGAEPSGPRIRFCRTRGGDGHEDAEGDGVGSGAARHASRAFGPGDATAANPDSDLFNMNSRAASWGGRLLGNKAVSPFTVTFRWSACPHRAARSIDSESFHRSDLTSALAQMLVQEAQVTHRVP